MKQPSRARTATKQVILFLAANPRDTGHVALDREARSIHIELKRSGHRDRFDFVTRWAAEPLDLLRELRELRPTVVHFSGHGARSGAATAPAQDRDVVVAAASTGDEPGGLSFHSTAGGRQVVSPEAIARTLAAAGAQVRLVVLNACFTEPIAEALLPHVDCVVGMSGAIHDEAARSFAIGFYGGLGEHESIAAAFAQGKAAIDLEGLPDAERPRLQVRDGLDATQLILAAAAPSVMVEVPCPYPGMRPFAADDARSFHGRDTEIAELIGRLRAGEREIFVIGPSGSGKSSLVTAGVLPRLARGVAGLGPFVVRELRPGEQPAARLGQLLEQPAGEPLVAADRVAGLLAHRGPGASLLIVVDQLEELFTQASADERARFLDALRGLRAERRCAVVFTLRADFFGALMESALWAERCGQLSRVEVSPLRGEALRKAITAPAHTVGVAVESELIERLVADAASEPGILPLLQETMVQLWDVHVDQTLTLADYQALGDGERNGLAVTLARRADATLRQFAPAEAAIARRILLRLISFGEGRSDTRRQQPRSQLCVSADDGGVLQQMIDDRLLTTDDDDDRGEARVDLAHEIMIAAWPTLAGWIRSHRADELRRRQLEAAAARWVEYGRSARGLLDPIELAEAELWQQTESAQQLGRSAEVSDLIAASRAAQIKQRRRRRGLLGTAFAVLAAFTVVVSALAVAERKSANNARDSANEAHQQADIARARSNELLLTHARSELEHDPASAIAWLKRYPEDGDDWARVQALALVAKINTHVIARHIWPGPSKDSSALVVSPNGHVVAIGSGNLCALWDTHTGRAISKFKVPPVARLAFSADGAELAIGGTDGAVVVVDIENKAMRTLGSTAAFITALFVAPDGSIVTGDVLGALQRWPIDGSAAHKLSQHSGGVYSALQVDRGAAIAVLGAIDLAVRRVPLDGSEPSLVIDAHALAPHEADIASLAIGAAGRSLAIGIGDRVLRWDEGKSAPVELGRHRAPVKVVAMSLTGLVVSGAEDGSIISWSANGPPHQLHGHVHAITAIAFDLDDERIASGDTSGDVRVWTSSGGELLRGHNGRIEEIAFASDHLVLSSSADKTVRAWLPTHAAKTIVHTGIGNVFGLAFLSSTTIIATQEDRSVQLVSLVTGQSRQIKRYERQAYGIQLLPGKRFTTSSWDGSITVFGPDSSELLHFDHGAEINTLTASRDGTYLATTGTDGATRLWSVSSGAGRLLEQRSSETNDVGFSPDGRVLVSSGADFELHVFDLTGRAAPRIFTGHTGVARSLTFSRDGHTLYSAGGDGTVRVWSLDPGTPESPIRTLHGPEGGTRTIALSYDERYLASGSADGIIVVWDLLDGYRVRYLRGHTAAVPHITFSPGSYLLASAGWDGTVRLWNLDDGSATGFRADEDKVRRVAFSPDGKFLASGGADGTVRIWSIADQHFIPSKSDALTRWMSEATTAVVHEPTVAHSEMVETPP
jgi:WD40 repeat protein